LSEAIKFESVVRKKIDKGRDGKPSCLVYEGEVYDAFASFLWPMSTHQVLHNAGVDLAEALTKSPHGSEFLKIFPIAGSFISSQN
jgi:predicted heme/steroid binding protein